MVSLVCNFKLFVMFDIRRLSDSAYESNIVLSQEPNVLEGSEVYETLCPVSKLTGFRENPLQLLSRVLDPAKVRLVDAVLQDIPSLVNEDGRISDSDALDMIVDRLSTGSPSEDAMVRNKLASMLDVLLPQEVRESVEQKIDFSPNDVPVEPNT